MNLKPIMRLLCHQREDRTYKVCNAYLLVCSRCLGIYAGFLFSFVILLLVSGFFVQKANFLYAFAFIVPMAADGLTQLFGLRESKNWLRFITGYLAGTGVAYLFYSFVNIKFIYSSTATLMSFELIPLTAAMLLTLFVLEKSASFKSIFLRKFFNSVAIFSTIFLIAWIIIFYSLILFKLPFS